jgi:hypothetical protein
MLPRQRAQDSRHMPGPLRRGPTRIAHGRYFASHILQRELSDASPELKALLLPGVSRRTAPESSPSLEEGCSGHRVRPRRTPPAL